MISYQTRYRISLAIRRNPESLKPHTGQVVEYQSVPFTVYTSSDKFVVLDAIFLDMMEWVDIGAKLDKTIPFVYKSLIPHKKDGIETHLEYSGTIHQVIISDFKVYQP